MRRITTIVCACLILALVISLSPVRAAAEEPAWVAAYKEVLTQRAAQAFREAEGLGVNPEIGFLVYDIDKDGTPELLIKYGTCEADFRGPIYTFRNGQAFQVGEDLFLGHASFYSDPNENGIILMHGHMGYAWAERFSITDGLEAELLYEDDLNPRLQEDPDAEYIYPGDVIPGSVYLSLCRWTVTLPLTRYEEIGQILDGVLPVSGEKRYPNGDTAFYDSLTANNGEVFAVTADGYTNSPGQIGFQDLLRQNVAAEWMTGDLSILSATPADLNGDGQLECVIAASSGASEMRIVLSEQHGVVFAYLMNYTDGYELEADGSFFRSNYAYRCRLVFEGEQAFVLTLPNT